MHVSGQKLRFQERICRYRRKVSGSRLDRLNHQVGHSAIACDFSACVFAQYRDNVIFQFDASNFYVAVCRGNSAASLNLKVVESLSTCFLMFSGNQSFFLSVQKFFHGSEFGWLCFVLLRLAFEKQSTDLSIVFMFFIRTAIRCPLCFAPFVYGQTPCYDGIEHFLAGCVAIPVFCFAVQVSNAVANKLSQYGVSISLCLFRFETRLPAVFVQLLRHDWFWRRRPEVFLLNCLRRSRRCLLQCGKACNNCPSFCRSLCRQRPSCARLSPIFPQPVPLLLQAVDRLADREQTDCMPRISCHRLGYSKHHSMLCW